MLTFNKFTPEEFDANVDKLAQEFANKVQVKSPGTVVKLLKRPGLYVLEATTRSGSSQEFVMKLTPTGEVQTEVIHGFA